jgi:hypothetical protein
MFAPEFIAVLACAASTLALPTTQLTKRITPNTQSCTAQDNFAWISYSVDIGVTYAGGSGCNNVYNSLSSLAITNWQCVDDGSGNTQLWFNTIPGAGQQINSALESMYPMVQGGFNCPNY